MVLARQANAAMETPQRQGWLAGNMLGAVMRAWMSYTVLRLLLFFAALWLLALTGIGGLLLLVLAAVVSMLISYVVLSRLRDSMSASLSGRLSRFRTRLDEGARSEDVDEPR
jgi:hypothetical protein